MKISTTAPLLAIETSVPTARVTVMAPNGIVLAAREQVASRHSANLLRLCDEALRAAGLRVADLAAVACGAGPGSFTGLRVGLAVAKGLALPTALPLVLISSLQALAHDLDVGADEETLIVPCIDAGKGEVYGALFRQGQGRLEREGDERAFAPETLAQVVTERTRSTAQPIRIGGPGLDRYADLFRAALGAPALCEAAPGPSAFSIGRLAWARLCRGESDDLARAIPTYGRAPDITRPKKK